MKKATLIKLYKGMPGFNDWNFLGSDFQSKVNKLITEEIAKTFSAVENDATLLEVSIDADESDPSALLLGIPTGKGVVEWRFSLAAAVDEYVDHASMGYEHDLSIFSKELRRLADKIDETIDQHLKNNP